MTLPSRMSGMVLTGHGGPDMLEWLDDLPVPSPGHGQVLIRVEASSVNNTDINTRTGWYSKSVRGDTASSASDTPAATSNGSWSGAPFVFPRVQGADCCGQIVAIGAGVAPERISQRVLVRALQSIRSTGAAMPVATMGTEFDGGFAEYTVVEDHHAIAITSPLSDVELASFPCAFSTAEAMIQRASLGAERVLITGASGGVGSAAIQLAARRGAQVTAVTTPAKAEALGDIGADHTLARNADFPDRHFDVVLDLVGGPRWPELLGTLRPGGRYVTSGAIAGPIVELDLRTLYLRDLTLFGSTHQPDSVFLDLVSYIEAGQIRPLLASTFPLRDLGKAQQAFLDKSFVGKIGITVSD